MDVRIASLNPSLNNEARSVLKDVEPHAFKVQPVVQPISLLPAMTLPFNCFVQRLKNHGVPQGTQCGFQLFANRYEARVWNWKTTRHGPSMKFRLVQKSIDGFPRWQNKFEPTAQFFSMIGNQLNDFVLRGE